MKNNVRFEALFKAAANDELEFYDIQQIDTDVVHFKIKGLKNWLWGIWYVQPSLTEEFGHFEVFCQYERFLDKFKPSRGAYCIKIEDSETYIDTYELSDVVNFIKKHEAMAFIYEDNITAYKGELYAKWKMFTMIARDIWNKWTTKRIYRKMHRWAKIFSLIKCINVAYNRDILNEDSCDEEYRHLNDIWFIYPLNPFGKWVAEAIYKMHAKTWNLGRVHIDTEEGEFLWSVYNMSLKTKKYVFETMTENDDGTINVDENELWAIVNQMADAEDIILYGEI